jgi:hypothetical protein
MYTRFNCTLLKKNAVIVVIFTTLFFSSCRDGFYADFLINGEYLNFDDMTEEVEVHMRLSSASLLEDELWIVNNSKKTIEVENKDVYFTIDGRDIIIPVEEFYDSFIRRINSKATLVCNEASDNYSCVDSFTNKSNSFRDQGYPFGEIAPGEQMKGFIAFNFPSPVNDSPLKEALTLERKKGITLLRGAIHIKVHIGETVQPFQLPAQIKLYDRLRDTPYDFKQFIQ